jgi:two-component system, chemotaxis family, sensor kinase CheA
MIEDSDIISEFLVESTENLARLDLEMVELEQQPERSDLLASIFRTIHTIKGTCGFLGFSRLEALAHVAEDVLNEVRQKRRDLDGTLTSLILHAVDAIKHILESIRTSGGEGEPFEGDVIAQLKLVRDNKPGSSAQPVTASVPDAAVEAPAESPHQPPDPVSAKPQAADGAAVLSTPRFV